VGLTRYSYLVAGERQEKVGRSPLQHASHQLLQSRHPVRRGVHDAGWERVRAGSFLLVLLLLFLFLIPFLPVTRRPPIPSSPRTCTHRSPLICHHLVRMGRQVAAAAETSPPHPHAREKVVLPDLQRAVFVVKLPVGPKAQRGVVYTRVLGHALPPKTVCDAELDNAGNEPLLHVM